MILVIDATQLCYRAKHSTGKLSLDETPTGVVFGFFTQLLTLSKLFGRCGMVFCWDSKESKRRDIFPEYKAKRRAAREEKDEKEQEIDRAAGAQFVRLRRDILPRLGFQSVQCRGYESDDIMAKYAGLNRILVTSDQDLYQCLDRSPMHITTTDKLYTQDHLQEELGVTPRQFLSAKIIAGCPTDEVPGVPGVGIVTACKYIRRELNPKTKKYQDIVAWLETPAAKRNTKLIGLPFPGLPPLPEPEKISTMNLREFISVCKEYGFASFLRKLNDWEALTA